MQFENTFIPGLVVIYPRVFEDPRGYFFESYNRAKFVNAGIADDFVQDNQSLSEAGVLRGMHFQQPPHAQSKLVRVIRGSVLDVVVDIRKGSPTYGKHYSIELSEENKTMLYIPIGFAHGFLTLKNETLFSYKCGDLYNKDAEQGIMWNDPALEIEWNIENPVLSEKDKTNVLLKDFDSPFIF
ncbi:MAG: dTDP-4-dehydrorhamnose 3,5-epimerase [Bacteroidetes bacterium]|nr:dTDP-4-dehydrorhamnose 3,5-epimerase [Bacteroidota bacterium]